MTDTHDLPQNKLIGTLPKADYERILPYLELIHMPAGKILCDSGEKLQFSYFPVDCIVSYLYITENGSTLEIAAIGNDGAVGIPLFTGGKSMLNQAVVQCEGYAYRIQRHRFMEEFNRYGTLFHVLLRYMQVYITQTAQTAVCNRFHSVEQRFCRWLLLSLDQFSSNELIMTQELIANILGVRREGITEAAGKLQKAGLIQYSRGHITVIDRLGLEARVCECYQVVKQESDRLLAA
jgi:CRP-like cAMP-binding protein